MVVAGGFFTFVLIQVNDAGVLESWNRLTSCSSKCLTTQLEDFGWYSIWARGLASLQLPDSLDGLCFCWQAIEGVNQGTPRHVLNCLVFDAGCPVQQLAEVCSLALQDVGFLRQKSALSDARIGVTVLVGGP